MKLLHRYVQHNVKTDICYHFYYRTTALFQYQTESSGLHRLGVVNHNYTYNPFIQEHIYTTVPKVRT